MDRELRKNRINLGICGVGVMAFAIWSVLKSFLYSTLTPASQDENEVLIDSPSGGIFLIMILVLFIVLIVDIILRIKIGLSARAQSKGRKKSAFYIGASMVLVLFSLANIVLHFMSMEFYSIWDLLATLIFEVSSIIILVILIISAIRVRSLERKIAGIAAVPDVKQEG